MMMKSCDFSGDRVAAVVLEPIQGEGGINVAPPGYLAAARELCDRYGAMLIFDEIQSGMGRTGKMFACEHDGVTPDLMALGKGFGGGVMPIGAVVGTPKTWERYIENPFLHTTTFGGNPVACAAAIATINVLLDEDLAAPGRREGRLPARQASNDLAAKYPQVLAVARGRGLMLGMEFTDNDLGYEVAKELFAAADPDLRHLHQRPRAARRAAADHLLPAPRPLPRRARGVVGRRSSAIGARPDAARHRETAMAAGDSHTPVRTDLALVRESDRGTLAEPTWSGITSFLRRRYTKDLDGVDVAVVGVPFDVATTGRPGTRFGPRAIRSASSMLAWCQPYAWDFDPLDKLHVIDWGDVFFDSGQCRCAGADHRSLFTVHRCRRHSADAWRRPFHQLTRSCRPWRAKTRPAVVDPFRCPLRHVAGRWRAHRPRHHVLPGAKKGIVDPSRSIQVGMRTFNQDTHGYQVLDARWLHRHGVVKAVEAHQRACRRQCLLCDFRHRLHRSGLCAWHRNTGGRWLRYAYGAGADPQHGRHPGHRRRCR